MEKLHKKSPRNIEIAIERLLNMKNNRGKLNIDNEIAIERLLIMKNYRGKLNIYNEIANERLLKRKNYPGKAIEIMK